MVHVTLYTLGSTSTFPLISATLHKVPQSSELSITSCLRRQTETHMSSALVDRETALSRPRPLHVTFLALPGILLLSFKLSTSTHFEL